MDLHSIHLAKVFRIVPLTCFTLATILLPLMSSMNAQTEERVFENAIPKHVPIKIQIKKEREQSFKQLANDKWVSEFELEVTNTGEKPIYYLALVLETNITSAGVVLTDNSVRDNHFVFDVRYGSEDLNDIITRSRPDDVPIKPGETYVLTVDSRETRPWEKSVRNGRHPQATRVRLMIQVLSFGDGTGLFTTGATPYPPSTRQ